MSIVEVDYVRKVKNDFQLIPDYFAVVYDVSYGGDRLQDFSVDV